MESHCNNSIPSISSTCSDKQEQDNAPPESFPFPFQPYSIQEDFMKNLYKALDGGKIGIFESPTGTGKSLSLICGALTWLRDYEEKQKQEVQAILDAQNCQQQQSTVESKSSGSLSSSATPDWVLEFDEKRAAKERALKLKDEQELILKREAKLEEIRNNLKQKQFKRKRSSYSDEGDQDENDNTSKDNKPTKTQLQDDDDDDKFIVEDYQSDEETGKGEEEDEGKEKEEEPHVTKIYYCSRTHSQLSQFVHEVQKSPYGETTRVVALGSRQNLCINETVKKLKSLSLINDRCLEMQKNKKEPKKDSDQTKPKKQRVPSTGCPYYNQNNMELYKDSVAAQIHDMEQLLTRGKQLKACPYYSTRYAIPGAQVVVLPYNTLLHKSTREACGIHLEGNIVIIDEAHNLVETISNVHSVEVNGGQLCCAHSQLSQYMEKYRSRLKAKNLMYIKQILQVLASWIRCLGGKIGCAPNTQKTGPVTSKLYTINDFLFTTQMDNINLFKLQKYCEKSRISRKLNGFVEKYQPSLVKIQEPDEPQQTGMTRFLQEIGKRTSEKKNEPQVQEKVDDEYQTFSSPLLHIEGFLLALTNADKDGRVVISKQEFLSQSKVKFLLLNPAVHFQDIVREARAIIVAGGTMQPVEEFKHQLLYCAGVQEDRIAEFSCGHVIPPDQLLPIALTKGPSGVDLDFTYQSRDTPKMMDEVGRVLANISNVVPGGVVVFFPSYDYEKLIYSHWEKTGVIGRLGAKKKVFREPRKANQVGFLLGQYTSVIQKACSSGVQQGGVNGAILLCVVGGKMSEGINFSDNLGSTKIKCFIPLTFTQISVDGQYLFTAQQAFGGSQASSQPVTIMDFERCIVMVGLPFANIKSPELKEKMDYLNATMPSSNGRTPGQVHYENLCMKAVNQSIGRAIRHKGDYATILLLDSRYARSSIQSKLPGWIARRLQTAQKFGPAFAAIRKFFVDKRTVCSKPDAS